jgi:hypothetical protein
MAAAPMNTHQNYTLASRPLTSRRLGRALARQLLRRDLPDRRVKKKEAWNVN